MKMSEIDYIHQKECAGLTLNQKIDTSEIYI